jgi:RHS repeat-associated protein
LLLLPDPDGSGPLTSPVWSYSYDTLGRRNKTTDPMNHSQTETFDADGHVLTDLDNLGHGVTDTYGHGGELLTTTDSLSHTTSDQYDSRFRLVQTTDANNGVTQITLDAAGNRVKLVDPANNQTTWVLDALNRPTSETNALGTTYTSYDASSDVTSITDADGRVRDFTFDNLHREIAEQWMNGNTVVDTISTAYDAANEVASIGDSSSSYAYAYNGDGQTTSTDNSGTPNVPHVVLVSGYDLAGDRTSLAATINGTKDFSNGYGFDNEQRLILLQQQQQTGGNGVAPKEIDLGYNGLGQFTAMQFYDYIGVGPRTDIATGTYSYDTGNRLTGLNYTADAGQTHIDAYTWGFDNANRVTSMTTTADGSATYGYDVVNELTSASYTGQNQPANESYSFDANGNRNMSGWTTGAANVITSDGTFNYQTDADGNRTVRTRISNASANDYQTKYFYDYRNRLTDEEYFNNGGTLTKHVRFVYDVLDRQIGEQIDDTGGGTYDRSQWFVFDGTQPIEQFDASGNLTARNLVGPNPAGVDAVMAQETIATQGQAGPTNYSLPDNLGTVRDSVNMNSALVDHVITNAYGQIASQTNPSAQPYNGFGGGHTDADTGDVLNLERRYDPATGGWTSKDPLDFGGGDANTGRYSGNSPTNTIDSTGLAANGANMFDTAVTAAMQAFFAPSVLVGMQMAAQHQQKMQAALQHMIDLYQAMMPNMIGMQQLLIAHQAAIIGAAAANAPIGAPNWVDTALAGASNFANGFANTITFGGVGKLNAALGNNAFVNPNSWWYFGGQVGGYVWSAVAYPMLWRACGGATWGFNVGPSGAAPSHVSFFTTPWGGGAATTATNTPFGIIPVGNSFYPTWFSVGNIPILFPKAALSNGPGWNCVTAAGHSLVTGWIPFL